MKTTRYLKAWLLLCLCLLVPSGMVGQVVSTPSSSRPITENFRLMPPISGLTVPGKPGDFATDGTNLYVYTGNGRAPHTWIQVGGGSGSAVLFGTATATGGSNGDTYVETDTGQFSKKAAGVWGDQVRLQIYSSNLATFSGITPGTGVAAALAATTNGADGIVVIDSSGNASIPGTFAVGSGGSGAGAIVLKQGTANPVGTTNITIEAPTSVTSYKRILPASAGSTGYVKETVSGTTQTESVVTTIPAADIAAGALASGMTATTQSPGDNDTSVATTAYVDAAVAAGGSGDTVISPSQITSNQDDYAPTGIATATIIRLDADSSLRYISSIAAQTGRRLRLVNVSANTIILRDKLCGLGTAANRMSFGGNDWALFPGAYVDLFYDGTSSMWRGPAPKLPTLKEGLFVSQGFFPYLATSSPFNFLASNSGTGSGSASISALSSSGGAVLYGETGTTNSGYGGFVGNNGTNWLLDSAWWWRLSFRFQTATASDGTDTYTMRAGFTDGVISTDSADGVYLRYTHGTNSGNWVLVLRNNSDEDATNLNAGPTFSSSAVNQIDIIIGPTRVEVWQNGANIGSTTTLTKLPRSRTTDLGFGMVKSAGTNNRIFYVSGVEVMAYRATP